ncbi:DUF6968 family protein [Roseococcus pinisoli]|uniref:DUF6968 domain-containing protein n=1 Tax=Roseococcus pinisoli TaxID=2835040 RepID=A0ABS5QJE4_9PROT|nr:hypothetical protein [Roseococcus pinisoli]MBS7813771.1 hypothetical protein [Roseococcus pinisoli]
MPRIPSDDLTDVIASRVMEVDGKPQFHIRIGRPTLAPEGRSWFCAYEIAGPLTNRKGRFGGEDAMQALVNALYCISVDVEVCAENVQGRLAWLGDTGDFGLPSPPTRSARGVSDLK